MSGVALPIAYRLSEVSSASCWYQTFRTSQELQPIQREGVDPRLDCLPAESGSL
jgi:hypothetical protein